MKPPTHVCDQLVAHLRRRRLLLRVVRRQGNELVQEDADPSFLLFRTGRDEFAGMGWTARLVPGRNGAMDLVTHPDGATRAYLLVAATASKRPAAPPRPSTPVLWPGRTTSLLVRIPQAWLSAEAGRTLQRLLQERLGSQARVERLPIGFTIQGPEPLSTLAAACRRALADVEAELLRSDPSLHSRGPLMEGLHKTSPMGPVPILDIPEGSWRPA